MIRPWSEDKISHREFTFPTWATYFVWKKNKLSRSSYPRMRLPRQVTPQLHQVLRLPWNNRSHPPTSNIAPAAQNDIDFLFYWTLPFSTLVYPSLLDSTLLHPSLLNSTLLYSFLFCSSLLCSSLPGFSRLYSTLLYSTLLYSTLLGSTLPCPALLCSALLYSTLP